MGWPEPTVLVSWLPFASQVKAVLFAVFLAVVIFAATLPTRASTGALLPLLLVGDLVAAAVYRRHASLSTLLRLLPGVLPGFLLGAWLVAVVDDSAMRTAIGLVLLAMTLAFLGLAARRLRRLG